MMLLSNKIFLTSLKEKKGKILDAPWILTQHSFIIMLLDTLMLLI